MNDLGNSPAARDIASMIHPYTNLSVHLETGPMIINEGKGIYVYDEEGKEYIEGLAGLWCTALGYGVEELVEAAAEQMRKLPYSHIFAHKSHNPSIELAEKLKEMSPSSRGWWKLSGTLLQKAGTREGIPPLQREDETWALTPDERAAELARVFRSKSQLPTAHQNDYSELTEHTEAKMRRMPKLTVSKVFDLLQKLDETSGTGPDLLPEGGGEGCP